MWSLNSNSILTSDCKHLDRKQSDCKQRAARREGSQKRKFASSNGSPRIMGLAPRGCIAVCRKSDGECSRWVPHCSKNSVFLWVIWSSKVELISISFENTCWHIFCALYSHQTPGTHQSNRSRPAPRCPSFPASSSVLKSEWKSNWD